MNARLKQTLVEKSQKHKYSRHYALTSCTKRYK